MLLDTRHGEYDLLKLKLSFRTETKGDLSAFERGCWCQTEFIQNADWLGFLHTTTTSLYREWSKKEKLYSEWQLCEQIWLAGLRSQRRMSKCWWRGGKGSESSKDPSLHARYTKSIFKNLLTTEAEGLQLQTTPGDGELRTGNLGKKVHWL